MTSEIEKTEANIKNFIELLNLSAGIKNFIKDPTKNINQQKIQNIHKVVLRHVSFRGHIKLTHLIV